MVRSRLELKKLECKTSLQTTFNKRGKGLIKKAYELSTLCDLELALLFFSPAGKLYHFSGGGRVEDVFLKFLNSMSPSTTSSVGIQNKENLEMILNDLKSQELLSSKESHELQELQRKVVTTEGQLKSLHKHFEFFKQNKPITSPLEVEERNRTIQDMINRVNDRKKYLQQKVHASAGTSALTTSMQLHEPLQQNPSLIPMYQDLVYVQNPMQLQPHIPQIPSTQLMYQHQNSLVQPFSSIPMYSQQHSSSFPTLVQQLHAPILEMREGCNIASPQEAFVRSNEFLDEPLDMASSFLPTDIFSEQEETAMPNWENQLAVTEKPTAPRSDGGMASNYQFPTWHDDMSLM